MTGRPGLTLEAATRSRPTDISQSTLNTWRLSAYSRKTQPLCRTSSDTSTTRPSKSNQSSSTIPISRCTNMLSVTGVGPTSVVLTWLEWVRPSRQWTPPTSLPSLLRPRPHSSRAPISKTIISFPSAVAFPSVVVFLRVTIVVRIALVIFSSPRRFHCFPRCRVPYHLLCGS